MTTLWASDTNYSDPGQTWDAQPTKVAPAAGVITQGFLPKHVIPGDWLNWAIATLGGRVVSSSDEYTYTTAKPRTKRGALHWGRNFGSWAQGQGSAVWTVAAPANDKIDIPLADLVPSGCTLTSVAAKVVSGAAGRTGANRMQISVYKSSSTGGATQVGTTGDDGGSSGSIQITTPGFSEVIDLSTYEYFVTVKAGASGTTETLASILVAFTDIGPRNA